MPCNYIYNGKEYTKDELAEVLSSKPDIFRSIATAPAKSKIVEDVSTVLDQRYSDAKNMLQAIEASDLSEDQKLSKMARYRHIMAKATEAKAQLLKKKSNEQLEFILDQAEIDARMVDALYNSPSVNFQELQFAQTAVETWSNIKRALDIESVEDIQDEPLRERLRETLNTYSHLSDRTRKIAISLIKQSANGPALSEDDIVKLMDTTIATEWLRELTTAGVPLTNKMSFIIKDVNMTINRAHNQNMIDIEEKYKSIKDNPIFKQQGWDLFIKTQKGKGGTETLGLVTRYSQKFWDAFRTNNKTLRTELKTAGADPKKTKAAWSRFNTWNEENTVAFNALVFIDSTKSDKERDNEIERIKSLGFTESEINDMIAGSQQYYEKYLKDKKEEKARLEFITDYDPSVIPTGKTAEEYVDSELQKYDDLNSPLKYMDQKFYGAQKITAYGGAKYSYLIPAKLAKGKETEYYDKNFISIASSPELYEFHKWFTNFMKENLSWFPKEETQNLQSNFLPVLADRVAKEYGFSALKESVKGMGDWFFKALTAAEYKQNIEVNPISKKERREFRARFLDEKVTPQERSKDLVLMAKMFGDMALIYKHKNTIKSEIDTLNDMVQTAEGSYIRNRKLNTLERSDKDAVRIKSLAEYTVRKDFYGLRSEDTMTIGDNFYDWKELATLGLWKSKRAKRAKAIEEEIRQLQDKIEDTNTKEEDRKEAYNDMSLLKEEYKKLGGRKFSLTAAIDSSIQSTRITALGFAPFSAMRNVLVGKVNNAIHAYGGRDFTQKNLRESNKIILSASGKYWSGGKFENHNTRLLFRLLVDAGIAEGEDGIYLTSMLDKKNNIDKFRDMLPKAYTWLKSGDYHFKAEMLVASMLNDTVKTSQGDVSFFRVLTETGEYNESEYGPWNEAANKSTFDRFYNDHMLKYKQLANKLHGASGNDLTIKAKDHAIGRLATLFKTWLPETVGVRFDPKHRDALLNRDEEGYYRTFAKLVMEKKLGIVKSMIQLMRGKDTGISDEMTLANFRKAIREMQIVFSMWMLYLLLKAIGPDDDDENKKMYNLFVLRQLHDLNRDMSYYFSISSAAELQQNVVPIVRTFQNWHDAIKAGTYYTLGVEDDDGELQYDGERTALKITKVLPVLSNANRIKYYTETAVEN